MANMRRQGQYSDPGINAAVSAQIQQMSANRAQHSPGINHFSGRPDSMRGEDERQYMSAKEGYWQWDRDGQRGANSLPSHGFREGSRSDSKVNLEKQAHEQEMDVGYEDISLPQTFDGLERKFLEDITKLTKEHHDAEDAENARHRERLIEINAQYQEKLLAVRSRQAAQRDEFVHKESQARYQQYQQAHLTSYPGPGDPHAFGPAGAAAGAVGEGHRPFGGSQFNSRERSQLAGGGRGRGFESRGPYPGGRAYGANNRYY